MTSPSNEVQVASMASTAASKLAQPERVRTDYGFTLEKSYDEHTPKTAVFHSACTVNVGLMCPPQKNEDKT